MISPHPAHGPRVGALLAVAWIGLSAAARPLGYDVWAADGFAPAERLEGRASPARDPDRDGWPNLLEYLLGSDPADPRSRPDAELAAGDGRPEVRVALAADRPDGGLRVLVSGDLCGWVPAAAGGPHGGRLAVPLGTMRFVRFEGFGLPGVVLDSDGDGLDDLFEEWLAAADEADGIEHIGQVDPFGDHDGDGIANLDEAEGFRAPGSGFPAPPVFEPEVVAAAADAAGPPPGDRLVVHTPLD